MEYTWAIDADDDGAVHVRLSTSDEVEVVDWRIPPDDLLGVLATLANHVPARPADPLPAVRRGLRVVPDAGPAEGSI